MARILIAFVAVILSFCVASALFFFGYEWFEEKLIYAVWWSGISSIGVGIFCLTLWTFRDNIFRFFKLSTKTGLQHMIDPVAEIVQHSLNGNIKAAANETKVLLNRLLSRYAAIKTMNWIIGTTFGFLAIFATMAATSVLIMQNELIDKQNNYFMNQNIKFDKQNGLIALQNEFFRAQIKQVQEQITQQNINQNRADRIRLVDILYQEKDVEKGKKRKIPKANLRSRQEAVLKFISLERDAGRHGRELDLSYAILSDLILSHDRLKKLGLEKALQGVNLRGAHLERTNFSGVNLNEASLVGAYLEEADLSRVKLEGANLVGANLEKARLFGARLNSANLIRADLDGVHGPYAFLEGATLWNANLKGAYLPHARLEEADLTEANLRDTHLAGAHLEGADLAKVKLEGANLASAHLERARVWTPHWIENIQKLNPPVKNFNYAYWSIAERKDEDGYTRYILIGPVVAKKPTH